MTQGYHLNPATARIYGLTYNDLSDSLKRANPSYPSPGAARIKPSEGLSVEDRKAQSRRDKAKNKQEEPAPKTGTGTATDKQVKILYTELCSNRWGLKESADVIMANCEDPEEQLEMLNVVQSRNTPVNL
jgi:hypothetical protein